MTEEQPTIQQQVDSIRTMLTEAGIEAADSDRVIADLNNLIQANLTEELMKELSEEDLEELETWDEADKTDPNKLSAFLDLTQDDITYYYEDSLTEYLNILPEQIPAIKKRLAELHEAAGPTSLSSEQNATE